VWQVRPLFDHGQQVEVERGGAARLVTVQIIEQIALHTRRAAGQFSVMPATLRRLAMETDWENVSIIDEKSSRSASCELCGTSIRYRHLLQHEKFHREISVGCICASRLTGNRYDAEGAERDLRNRNSRLRNFMDLSKWDQSRTNSENITRTQRVGKRELRVTIFKSYGTYGFTQTRPLVQI
jgi:hypothetical protein